MRMVSFNIPVVLVSLALSLGSGCALVNGTTQRVAISTSVPGARVVVDGKPAGFTREGGEPLVVILKRADDHIVSASKDGYTSNYIRIENKLSTLGILDAIGTWLFLLPGISILTGSAMELTPSDVYLTLDRQQAPATSAAPPVTDVPPPVQPIKPQNTTAPP